MLQYHNAFSSTLFFINHASIWALRVWFCGFSLDSFLSYYDALRTWNLIFKLDDITSWLGDIYRKKWIVTTMYSEKLSQKLKCHLKNIPSHVNGERMLLFLVVRQANPYFHCSPLYFYILLTISQCNLFDQIKYIPSATSWMYQRSDETIMIGLRESKLLSKRSQHPHIDYIANM